MADFGMWDIGGAPNVQASTMAAQNLMHLASGMHNIASAQSLQQKSQMIPDEIAIMHDDRQRSNMQLKLQQQQQKMIEDRLKQRAAGQQQAAGVQQRYNMQSELFQTQQDLADMAGVFTGTPEGIKFANAAANVGAKLSTMKKNEIETIHAREKADVAEANWLLSRFDKVRDQLSLEQLNAEYQTAFGEASPLVGKPFNPAMIQQLKARTLSEKERRELSIRERDLQSKQDIRKAHKDHIKWQEDVGKQYEMAGKKAEARANTKVGSFNAPSPKNVKAAEDLIDEAMPTLAIHSAEKANISRRMAESADRLHRGNPALSYSEALQAVFAEEQRKQTFDQYRAGAGATGSTAIPLPNSNDPRDFKSGKYYYNNKGQVAQFKGIDKEGRAIFDVQEGVNAGRSSSRPVDDDEDDDE